MDRTVSDLWRDGRIPGSVELAYGRTGEGGDPVLALHGITANHRVFGPVARRLQHPDGMVGLDLRGRGRSAKPPAGSYGIAAHAADVIRTLDHLQLDRVVITAHSMGAFIATHVAASWPDRVRALALLDGGWPRKTPPRPSLDPTVWQGFRRAFERLDRTFRTVEEYLEYWHPGARLEELAPEVLEAYTYDLEQTAHGFRVSVSLPATNQDAQSMFWHSPSGAELARVRCPVLLIRAGAGFTPGAPPLFKDVDRSALAARVDLCADILLSDADHYSLLTGDHARATAAAIDWLIRPDTVAPPVSTGEERPPITAAGKGIILLAGAAASLLALSRRNHSGRRSH